jgi:hypothetical protein
MDLSLLELGHVLGKSDGVHFFAGFYPRVFRRLGSVFTCMGFAWWSSKAIYLKVFLCRVLAPKHCIGIRYEKRRLGDFKRDRID